MVQEMFGYASSVLAADIYVSVVPELAREAAERITAVVLEVGCLARARSVPPRHRENQGPREHPASIRATVPHAPSPSARPPSPPGPSLPEVRLMSSYNLARADWPAGGHGRMLCHKASVGLSGSVANLKAWRNGD